MLDEHVQMPMHHPTTCSLTIIRERMTDITKRFTTDSLMRSMGLKRKNAKIQRESSPPFQKHDATKSGDVQIPNLISRGSPWQNGSRVHACHYALSPQLP